MDTDLDVLRYIAKYQARNHSGVTWYALRFIDQDERILRYGNPVKALRALEEKGYLDKLPPDDKGHVRYHLSPAGEALLAESDHGGNHAGDESGRSE